MKADIHLLDKDLKNLLAARRKDEKYVEKKENEVYEANRQLDEAERQLRANDKERSEEFKMIRTIKINEIQKELDLSDRELDDLQDIRRKILNAYCEKNGHHYLLIENNTIDSLTVKENYQCAVCGSYDVQFVDKITKNIVAYKEEIPNEIYDDNSLDKNGKTFRMTQSEIESIETYIDYLMSLKSELCEIFGHDLYKSSRVPRGSDYRIDGFRCNCCEQFFDERQASALRDLGEIYDKYNCIPNSIPKNLSLSTYNSYQKTLKRNK